ncbi:hypothetical protein DFH08DRAFT_1078510 [Mycena albidolilacea]|uniref:Uncharacterized protein n=1 Tax=Mycena albidolilacea TaxID=1033008 RepID=A0AAD7A849_9AGAR|nr:hypothetical protein DFH08DRAFT_1078510 [Mycena albidolilacea]
MLRGQSRSRDGVPLAPHMPILTPVPNPRPRFRCVRMRAPTMTIVSGRGSFVRRVPSLFTQPPARMHIQRKHSLSLLSTAYLRAHHSSLLCLTAACCPLSTEHPCGLKQFFSPSAQHYASSIIMASKRVIVRVAHNTPASDQRRIPQAAVVSGLDVRRALQAHRLSGRCSQVGLASAPCMPRNQSPPIPASFAHRADTWHAHTGSTLDTWDGLFDGEQGASQSRERVRAPAHSTRPTIPNGGRHPSWNPELCAHHANAPLQVWSRRRAPRSFSSG